jgi:DNA-binding CsgD family transcriptional regulator
MQRTTLGMALGVSIGAVAVLNLVSSLTRPLKDGRPGLLAAVGAFGLLAVHAGLYWFGSDLRRRLSVVWYVGIQASVVFAFGLTGAFLPAVISVYAALTAEAVVLAGGGTTVLITVGAIFLFAIDLMIASDLYQGATFGLLIAATGLIAHALTALRRSPALEEVAPPHVAHTGATEENGSRAKSKRPSTIAPEPRGMGLTHREIEVLRAVVDGARNDQIASQLTITQRTVKAHLATIYLKLGVRSRAAAVAKAIRNELLR